MTNTEYLFQPTLKHSLDEESVLVRALFENLPPVSNDVCIASLPGSEGAR